MPQDTIILHLWVRDQPTEHDCTKSYIDRSGSSSYCNPEKDTLTGSQDEAWAEYVRLRNAVAAGGHGNDMNGTPIRRRPQLTACPVNWKGLRRVAQSNSLESDSYAAFLTKCGGFGFGVE